jgi:lysozyme
VKLSDVGAHLIASYEGWVDHPYNDPSRYATIGYGHLLHTSPVTAADRGQWGTITPARGIELLKQDAAVAENAIRTHVKVPLTQNEFDALVSFIFNVGAGAFAGSTLLKRLNAGDHHGAADELLKWNRSAGRVLPGLDRRRHEERALFLKHDAKVDPLAGYPKDEQSWIHEFDRLKREGKDPARRAHLRALMAKRRKSIWSKAQPRRAGGDGHGWDSWRRRARYHSLLIRA